jgi:hypothetical protein
MNITEQYQKVSERVNINDFFTISISEFDISCLAWHTPARYSNYKKDGFEFTLNTKADYLEATKDGIKIILSLNKP